MYRVLALLLSIGLLFRGLPCENLLCYYCPLQVKNEICRMVQSKCPPQELCFKAKGWHNGYIGLTTSGCATRQQCTTEHHFRYRGTNFTMTYTCCDWNLCNSAPRISFLVSLLVPVAFLLTLWMC
ncbi:prostate and testis expressed protein 3-like [Arapaima gigas]